MGPVPPFLLCTVIWGSTWLAITFQLPAVAPEASVAYRFALAATLIGLGCLATRRSLRFPLRRHTLFVAQGALFFGLNYVSIYRAEQYVASGLVAVLFSTMAIMSLFGARYAFGTPITARALAGANSSPETLSALSTVMVTDATSDRFIVRCDLAVGGKRSQFRLHLPGADKPLDARLRRVPPIPVVAAGWHNECERLRNPPSTYARGNFRRHISRE